MTSFKTLHMDRRNSIKALVVGSISGSMLLDACKTPDKKEEPGHAHDAAAGGEKRPIPTMRPS